MTKTGRTVPRQRWQFPPIDYTLVGAGAGLGLLWALLSIPIGAHWVDAPVSGLGERVLAFALCLPLFAGLYLKVALDRLGIVWDPTPLILLAGSAIGALAGLLVALRVNR